MQLIKRIPLPMAGLMLAFAAIGNLLESYGSGYRWFFGIISLILLIVIIMKILVDPGSIKEGLSNPVIASVMPTFSMGVILLAGYLKTFAPAPALYIWILGITLHIAMMAVFTKKHILGRKVQSYMPSYFIVYVGIVTVSVTAPVFERVEIGQLAFWFGLIAFVLLLYPVMNRIFKIKNIPEPAQPTVMILAAPMSLLLAGYLRSFPEKSVWVLGILGIISLLLFSIAVSFLPKLFKLKFYPSYSAFTFPVVITAIAIKGLFTVLSKAQPVPSALFYLVNLLELGSLLIVFYVFLRYIAFLHHLPFLMSSSKSTQS